MHRSTPDESRPATDESAIARIGKEFRRLRTVRGERLEDVADYLTIRPTFLYGIEQGDLSVMPGARETRAFVRSYADYLGLDGSAIVGHILPITSRSDDDDDAEASSTLLGLDRLSAVILAASILLGIAVGWSYIASVSQLDLLAAPVTADDDLPDGDVSAGADRAAADPAALPAADPDALPAAESGDPTPAVAAGAPALTPADGEAAEAEKALAELKEQSALLSSERVEIDQGGAIDTAGTAVATLDGGAATGQLLPGERVEDPANLLAALVAQRGDGAQIYEPENTDARVIVRARASAWVQVSSESRDYIWTRTMQPKEMLLVPNRDDLELWTGDAGGVEILLDGLILPPLGPPGTVIRGLSLAPASLEATSAADLSEAGSKPTF